MTTKKRTGATKATKGAGAGVATAALKPAPGRLPPVTSRTRGSMPRVGPSRLQKQASDGVLDSH